MKILPGTARHLLPDGRVTLLGAIDTVTGAMTLVETGGKGLLVDCGIAQGQAARDWRFPDAARSADAVVLTHGHLDHVGSLPALLDTGFEGPIVATRATLAIAELVLSDSLRIGGRPEDEIAGFRRRLKAQSVPVAYDAPHVPAGFAGSITFHEAGHILGSTSVEIETQASRVICSGDLGRPNSPLLRDYNTRWTADRPVDLVVLETTYGDREHGHTHADVERELERIIQRALQDGGHILIPAFAIGRTQTLLYHLNTLVEAGRIPSLPVAVDTPMGLKVTELYQHSRQLFDRTALDQISRGDDPLDFDNLFAVHRGRDSARLRDVQEPMLIIAGSGMCTGGRIVAHLRELLPLEETCVLFVGFQAKGTPGAAIQRARNGETVWLDGEDVPVRASIETLSGLSAHADRSELWRWLSAIPNVRTVGLHHGEADAQQQFAAWATTKVLEAS